MTDNNSAISAAIIGRDEWAFRMAEVISALSELELRQVACGDEKSAARWKKEFAQVQLVDDWEQLLESETKIVFLSVESFKARNMIEALLAKNISILASAPWDDSASGMIQLQKSAEDKGLLLRVDKGPLYSPVLLKAVDGLKDLRELFSLEYRLEQFGGVKSDLGVHWALGFSPLAVIVKVLGGWPKKIDCQGGSYLKEGICDTAWMTFSFPENRMAHVKVGWYEPEERNRLVISGAWGIQVLEFGAEKHTFTRYDRRIRYLDGQLRIKEDETIGKDEFDANEGARSQIKRFVADLRQYSAEEVTDAELAQFLTKVDVALKLSRITPSSEGA